MAIRSFQTCVFGLLATMVLQGLSPAVTIQASISSMAPSPSWEEYRNNKLSPIDSSDVDSCQPQFYFFSVISLRWNRDVLPCRRLVSGESILCRWSFRLSIGVCPSIRRYGFLTWVFDPGINKLITMAEGIRFTRARIGNFTQTMMGLHIISGVSLTMFAKLGVERVYLDCVDGLLVKFVVSTRLSNSYEDKRSHPQNCEDRGCLQISTKARQFVVMTNLVPYGFFGSRVVIDKCPDLQTLTSHLVASRPSQTVLIDVNPNTNWNYDMDCFQCKARKILKNQSRDVFLMELHSTTYYLLWKQPWGRQRILQHRHKEPLLHSSNILISMRRKDPESSPTTLSLNLLVNVMPRAFWSLSYKLLANIKCMKGGHNRLYLLACKTSERIARLYSTPSSKLFQFHVFAYNGCFGMFLLFVTSY